MGSSKNPEQDIWTLTKLRDDYIIIRVVAALFLFASTTLSLLYLLAGRYYYSIGCSVVSWLLLFLFIASNRYVRSTGKKIKALRHRTEVDGQSGRG